jgi:hypothetical protein
MNKRGAIELSFGMIFSIIIMIAIIGVAVYAISAFLDIGKTSKLGLFHQKFQEIVDEIWASSITNRIVSFTVPGNIEFVCFGELDGNSYNPQFEDQFTELKRYASGFEQRSTNRFLYPPAKAKDFAYKQIDKIDISGLTNGFDCFRTREGTVKIRFVKEEFDPFVRVEHE